MSLTSPSLEQCIDAKEHSWLVVNAEYDENSTDLITNIIATNNESQDYTGSIRVYLTEIISRWNQANSEPYHFALVDYIIYKDSWFNPKTF